MDSSRRRRNRWGPEVDDGGATETKHTAPELPARAPGEVVACLEKLHH